MTKEVLLSLPGIALTVFCWGAYGPVLHVGQHDFGGSRLKPLICVGLAYLIVAVLIPGVALVAQGKLAGDWSTSGVAWSLAAGAAGAVGALGIILAMTAGGKPVYVMPLVFGCAPAVNVAVAMYFAKISWANVNMKFIAGLLLVSIGAVMVLRFQPKAPAAGSPPAAQAARGVGGHDAAYAAKNE
jgi:hypothetical protein